MMNSGGQDRPRNNQILPPEVPRRPTLTTNGATVPASGDGATVPSQPTATPRHDRSITVPAIREIHKNAWLKRLHTSYDKKGAPFVKRSEKWWVVFCVHDDVNAYLEFYTEPKMAQVHKPAYRVNLSKCLHVSPSIVGQDNEYQFAVTLASQVICLAAPEWDQMLEWVESLQGKLREMNIISPKDNLYSKLPETRNCSLNTTYALAYGLGVMSTRDPNSPLPPTPNGHVSPDLSFRNSAQSPSTGYIDTSVTSFHQTSITLPDGRPSSDSTSSTSVYIQPSVNGISYLRDGNNSDSGNGSGGSILSIDSGATQIVFSGGNLPSQNNNAAATVSIPAESRSSQVGVIIGTNNNSTLVQIGFENGTDEHLNSSLSIPITPNPAPECLPNPTSANPRRRLKSRSDSRNKTDPGLSFDMLQLSLPVPHLSSSISYTRQLSEPALLEQNAQPSPPTETLTQSVYEHLFTPVPTRNSDTGATVLLSNASDSSNEGSFPPVIPRRNPNGRRIQRRPVQPVNQQDQLNASRENVITVVGNSQFFGSQSQATNATDESSSTTATPEATPLDGMIGLRRGEYRIAVQREEPSKPDVSAAASDAPSTARKVGGVTHVPLKESQVMRLNTEIKHAAGVRIVLRKKDCLDTIAFVDHWGAVWIAGWKQQQNPVLYYAFHVGDQVVKVGGENVQSSEETRRAIKMTTSHQVEFIIRRLPYGRVFVLKRKVEGEPLGLVAIGNCAEISEVVPNSLAAAEGLPPKAAAVDGQSLCNWFLTEINNRPLSLIARESEVRDRLNAVGKEISILVQPSDLVKHLKKQLKSIKTFKEYLVV